MYGTGMSRSVKLDRNFGKCRISGCKTRRVINGDFIDGKLIHYQGHNEADLRSINVWCNEHDTFLKFNQLKGRVNRDKECNGVCMAGIGPSCDCACGGENHGKNHV